jgi:hypothetical protein
MKLEAIEESAAGEGSQSVNVSVAVTALVLKRASDRDRSGIEDEPFSKTEGRRRPRAQNNTRLDGSGQEEKPAQDTCGTGYKGLDVCDSRSSKVALDCPI